MNSERALIFDYRATWEQVIRGVAPISELDRYFHLPCLMVSNDGSISEFSGRNSVSQFNQTRLDAFRSGGVYSASLRAVDFQTQGPNLTLATVNWELARRDGSLERAWRHYYTILVGTSDNDPSIIVSAFQTGS